MDLLNIEKIENIYHGEGILISSKEILSVIDYRIILVRNIIDEQIVDNEKIDIIMFERFNESMLSLLYLKRDIIGLIEKEMNTKK